ncbi:radical SAM protein, partial [Candidatus Woesearchaeota archaeon]|nr:radical SAM protein [Candidatus Woesearchaeota archaeon]
NVDWLLRKYKYDFKELRECLGDDDMLPDADPKVTHAKRFLDGPVDVASAGYSELIRVPGIGMKTARNIMSMRRGVRRLKREHLQRAGAILKRADPFVKVDGWRQKTLCAF